MATIIEITDEDFELVIDCDCINKYDIKNKCQITDINFKYCPIKTYTYVSELRQINEKYYNMAMKFDFSFLNEVNIFTRVEKIEIIKIFLNGI